jgi:signal transduction histidine kinase
MRARILRRFHLSPLLSFLLSVRVRLTLWYSATILIILLVLSWSFHSNSPVHLSPNTIDSQVETQLDQNIVHLATTYKQALLSGQPPASQPISLSTKEIVLLLRSDGSILDTRGPLTNTAIQQLRAKAKSGQVIFTLTQIQQQSHTWEWWDSTNEYQIFIAPILNKDTRIAILVVGLPQENWTPTPFFWFVHDTIFFLISIIGGYILASKAMRPVRMITKMANEINATDLCRRLHLQRRDEFGELAATFDQMLARLEAAFKRQTQFAADASHELRTPLTIINLEINRALTQLQAPEEYRQILEQIQAENEQMTAIVNSLLLLARADTGQTALHREKVDLSDLALASVERLLPLAHQSQVTLSTGNLPELLIIGDPNHLNRMLTNLLENAIKYTSGIGKRVHVSLTCDQEQWGVIRVQDDGPGIAEEHIPYLFDRFYRVDKARTRKQKEQAKTLPHREEPGGTGLGLAIVQWIVQAHGGEIRVESEIGAGSTFEVRLSLLKQE